jgi:hypothetical protein
VVVASQAVVYRDSIADRQPEEESLFEVAPLGKVKAALPKKKSWNDACNSRRAAEQTEASG